MKLFLVFILIIIILILLKLCPKYDSFDTPLNTPKVIKVVKENSNAIVEWYDHNLKVEDYILLYVDIDKLSSGVWLQSKVKCDTKRCRVILKNLYGNTYKLAVLSRKGKKLSVLKQTDIVTFSNDKEYSGVAVDPKDVLVAEGDNLPLPKFPSPSHSPSEVESKNKENPGDNNKTKSQEDTDTISPNPSPSLPQHEIDCSDGSVKLKNINSMEELESATVVPKCQKLENLTPFMEKPFYHNMLDSIF